MSSRIPVSGKIPLTSPSFSVAPDNAKKKPPTEDSFHTSTDPNSKKKASHRYLQAQLAHPKETDNKGAIQELLNQARAIIFGNTKGKSPENDSEAEDIQKLEQILHSLQGQQQALRALYQPTDDSHGGWLLGYLLRYNNASFIKVFLGPSQLIHFNYQCDINTNRIPTTFNLIETSILNGTKEFNAAAKETLRVAHERNIEFRYDLLGPGTSYNTALSIAFVKTFRENNHELEDDKVFLRELIKSHPGCSQKSTMKRNDVEYQLIEFLINSKDRCGLISFDGASAVEFLLECDTKFDFNKVSKIGFAPWQHALLSQNKEIYRRFFQEKYINEYIKNFKDGDTNPLTYVTSPETLKFLKEKFPVDHFNKFLHCKLSSNLDVWDQYKPWLQACANDLNNPQAVKSKDLPILRAFLEESPLNADYFMTLMSLCNIDQGIEDYVVDAVLENSAVDLFRYFRPSRINNNLIKAIEKGCFDIVKEYIQKAHDECFWAFIMIAIKHRRHRILELLAEVGIKKAESTIQNIINGAHDDIDYRKPYFKEYSLHQLAINNDKASLNILRRWLSGELLCKLADMQNTEGKLPENLTYSVKLQNELKQLRLKGIHSDRSFSDNSNKIEAKNSNEQDFMYDLDISDEAFAQAIQEKISNTQGGQKFKNKYIENLLQELDSAHFNFTDIEASRVTGARPPYMTYFKNFVDVGSKLYKLSQDIKSTQPNFIHHAQTIDGRLKTLSRLIFNCLDENMHTYNRQSNLGLGGHYALYHGSTISEEDIRNRLIIDRNLTASSKIPEDGFGLFLSLKALFESFHILNRDTKNIPPSQGTSRYIIELKVDDPNFNGTVYYRGAGANEILTASVQFTRLVVDRNNETKRIKPVTFFTSHRALFANNIGNINQVN